MDVIARLRFLRYSPRKVRLVVDMVRGKDADKALAILSFDPHHPTRDVKKLIESALANAKHNFHLEASNMYVQQIRVDGGPTLKRNFPRAMGRAAPIRRRTSHVTVVLGERVAQSRGTQKSRVKSQNSGVPRGGT